MITNFEKRKLQAERIGVPTFTYEVIYTPLTEKAELLFKKESISTGEFNVYYNDPEEDLESYIKEIHRAGVYKGRPDFYWMGTNHGLGASITFYRMSELKYGKDFSIDVTKKKNKLPAKEIRSFADIIEI